VRCITLHPTGTDVCSRTPPPPAQAFEKIQLATGIEEIDQLVNSFISAEGQNYTL